jgi:hypothetical protein
MAAATLMCLAAGAAHSAETIRMLAPTWLGFAPVHVANDLGCFQANNLEVDYKFEDDRANVIVLNPRDLATALLNRGANAIELGRLDAALLDFDARDRDSSGTVLKTLLAYALAKPKESELVG